MSSDILGKCVCEFRTQKLYNPNIRLSLFRLLVTFFIITNILKTGITQERTGAAAPPNELKSVCDEGATGRDLKVSRWGALCPTTIAPFKGAIPELSGKVFVSGPFQVIHYDEYINPSFTTLATSSISACTGYSREKMRVWGISCQTSGTKDHEDRARANTW